jgi:hypothetical protein
MSSGSGDEDGGGGGGLMRVISGPRRNTAFGQVADRGDGRKSLDGGRRSFDAGTGNVGGGVPGEKGTWYWRVQAGVDDVSRSLAMVAKYHPESISFLPIKAKNYI